MNYFFVKIFSSSLRDNFPDKNGIIKKQELDELESALQDFIYNVMSFRFDNNYNIGEVRTYFDNICRHLNFNRSLSLVAAIKIYQEEYLELLKSHHYTELFINVLKRIFSKEYDGKLLIDNGHDIGAGGANILHYSDFIVITKQDRHRELLMPAIKISSIDRFEEILRNYVEAVKGSNTFYNIFSKPGFDYYDEDEKIMMILEGTIFNATNYEFTNIEDFFYKYTKFVVDNSFDDMQHVEKIGEAFDDELYAMIKRSSFEYETPYYFSFILNRHALELPNTRIAISKDDSKKFAYIMATQSSQITPANKEVSEMIKQSIPKTVVSKSSNPNAKTTIFRNFSPDHLVSILLTFGVLNGMGIRNIVVSDYMPLRCYKTIKDKKMDEEEATRYVNRVVNKNIYTYFKLASICNGIEVTSIPDAAHQFSIHLDDVITCENEFLTSLYNMGYAYGLEHRMEEEQNYKK